MNEKTKMENGVKLFGVWGCPFSTRVEIALQMKGIRYEFVQEDMNNKSEELLKYNPITKKIPVFVHNGQPIIESIVILEYIDDIWKDNPLLPVDPYQRAQARFWAKFFDEKIDTTTSKALPMKGEGTQNSIDELLNNLEILENEMKVGNLFKESTSKFVDIVALFLLYWVPLLQESAHKYIFTREKFPHIYCWADEIFNCSIVSENLPDRVKMLAYLGA
ncbi:hypothetical protein RND81_05G154200 [Saponaria officinalis]|uniref:glutathione transferase n=1 Tax=Saponaria officinalis TaxID=3572 RepID=A0AAW1KXY3_SAPOF